MLQPSQLKEIAQRDVQQIAELRHFLRDADIAVETPEALHSVAARLRQDNTFHRDLTLHVWVLLDRLGRQAGYPDLLAVLALAGAGQEFAAATTEADAHVLLRFLMEARRSFEAEAPPLELDEPAMAHRGNTADAVNEPLVPEVPAIPPVHPLSSLPRDRRWIPWSAAIACLLAFIAAGGLFYHRFTGQPKPAVTAAAPATAPSGRQPDPQLSTPDAEETSRSDAGVLQNRSESGHSRPIRSVPQHGSHQGPLSASVAPMIPNGPSAPAVSAAPVYARPSPEPATAVVAPASSAASSVAKNTVSAPVLRASLPAPAMTKAVPADTLSHRLGARSVPTYAATDDRDSNGKGWHYPRLLRRHPVTSTPAGGETEQIAEMQPSELPMRPGSASHPQAAPSGTVRPGSLGIMAGNIVYSPAPAYPAAASAAHVQGEVKLQAEVDRDGNVTYARVVSGPPLLRDAALDAVQHWRYRPYLAHGKPIPMTAAAVVEFELP